MRSVCAVLILSSSVFSGGCASRPVRIPLGSWYGKGTFVMERWSPADKAASVHGEYPTRLRIRCADWDGRPAREFEIVSRHGGIPDIPEKETHLRFLLIETNRFADDAVVFRLIPLNAESGEPEKPSDLPPLSATCIRTKGAVVLQIVYTTGFVDTFRFKGKGVTKAGSFADDSQLIHWAETLYDPDDSNFGFGFHH